MALKPGNILSNRYRVIESIGRGGMADVFKVWDGERATPLALKLLREDLAQDPVFLRRFQREGKNLSLLQHPNIVRFYGLERSGLLAYMLMEFVDGDTLRAELLLREGKPYSPSEMLQIITPVCSALHYAHRKGLVHCDVKPGNIMLEKTGRVLVADFGIARLSEGATTATMVGAGTPAYMAPEQIQGKDPTPQTDIYSLGIVMYEMLSGGHRPFSGKSAKSTGSTTDRVRWEQLYVNPPTLRRANPAVSPALEAVVMHCLAKNPADRYRSVMDVLQELQETVSGGVEGKRTVSKVELPVIVVPPIPTQSYQVPPIPPQKAQPSWNSNPLVWIAILGGVTIWILVGVVLARCEKPVPSVVTPTHETALLPTLTAWPTNTFEPTQTMTAMPPTPTFTQTFIPTPSEITGTIIENTNCRYGPSTYYSLIKILYQDDSVVLLGTDKSASWFDIEIDPTSGPQRTASDCWINKNSIQVSYQTKLPVLTPPELYSYWVAVLTINKQNPLNGYNFEYYQTYTSPHFNSETGAGEEILNRCSQYDKVMYQCNGVVKGPYYYDDWR